MPDSEKYLDFTGLSHYDGKVKEVIQKDITSAWVASTSYAVGAYAVYNGLLYRCKTAHTSGSKFDTTEAANWDQVKIIDDIITAIKTTADSAVQTVSGTSPVSVTASGTTRTVALADAYGDTKNPYGSKTANYVLAAPNGSNGAPSFRALVAADIPDLSGTYIPKSIVTAAGDLIVGSGNGAVARLAKGANGKFLTVDSNGNVAWGDTVSANDAKLTINGATSSDKVEFTANASTDVSGTIDKSFVGLGNVVNTGDSDTPTSGGTTKFTTGGAYTLKQDLETMIRTQASHFRGSWSTWANVPSTATDYPADADGNKTPTANDYMIVEDASDYPVTSPDPALSGTWRFIYTGVWSTNGKNGWEPAYKIESPSLTFKTINTTNTTSQATSASESITGTGTINLHKVAKTGDYTDLLNKPTIPTSFSITVTDDLLDGTGGANSVKYAPYSSKGAGHLYTGTTNPSSTNRLNYDGYFYATKLYSGGSEVLTSHQSIPVTDVQVNGTSVVSSTVANIVTEGVYNATTNKIATMADMPEVTFNADPVQGGTSVQSITVGTDSYNFPSASVATSSATGTVKLFSDTAQSVAANAVSSTASRTYGIQLNGSGQAVVNVPWTDTASAVDNILDGSNSGTAITYAPYVADSSSWASTAANAGKLYTGAYNPSATNRLNYNGYLYATQLYDNGSRVVNLADAQTITGAKTFNSYVKIEPGTNNSGLSIAWGSPLRAASFSPVGIAVDIANSAYGYLISYPSSITDDRTITFPDKSGTIAVTSDIPSVSLTQAASGSGDTAKTTTTWGLGSTSVVFESITKTEINGLFALAS